MTQEIQTEPITLTTGEQMYVDELDSLEIKKNRTFEKQETEFIKSFLHPNMVCVDVGANIGYFTILMGKYAKVVYAFEPDPINRYILSRNILLNELSDFVSVYPEAVGENEGFVTLYRCHCNNGMHRIYRSQWHKTMFGATKIRVPMISLDAAIGGYQVDFVKIDVEGSELGVLKGMQKVIENQRPTIMMEFHVPSIKEYGADPSAVYSEIKKHGYDISLIDRPIEWRELNFLSTHNPCMNLVCRPLSQR